MSNYNNDQSGVINQVNAAKQAGPVAQLSLLIPAGITVPRAIYDSGAPNGIKGAFEYYLAMTPENFPNNQNEIAFVFTNDATILAADVDDVDSFNNEDGQSELRNIDDKVPPEFRLGPLEIKQKLVTVGFRYIGILFEPGQNAEDFTIGMEVGLSDPEALDVVGFFQ